MTLTASNTNELLYDNNTVKTHHDNRSDFLTKLGFLDKIFGKKYFFLFATKFMRILRRLKRSKPHQRLLTASDANELLCDNNTVKTHHVNRSVFFNENLAF